ncbi:PX domain-containing protein kinase-like protein isoform X2 [Sitodiplosis mosellana]|nr:PX domain-containing protein kinase-like protein isoform X2 [Sitodiplosis mosellana]
MRPEFIAERRLALQNYINIVLMNPILASSLPAKKFVDPESYNQSFHDIAVQNAALCLRTEGAYTLGKTLGLIGWRIRKHYFKVTTKANASGATAQSSGSSSGGSHSSKHILTKSSSQSHSKLLSTAASLSLESQPKCLEGVEFLTMAWSEYGPDKYIDEKEIHSTLKSLTTIQHPFIMPIEYVASNDSGALFIRNFYTKGSLKDLLYGTSPKNPFLQKYGNPIGRGRGPMAIKDIAIYGRQILEALQFLHSKGLPCGHIHAGNVIIVDGVARLVDIENFILGVASFYRPFFMQHSKINTYELIDVYSFAHLLYELTFGYPLQESIIRHPIECPSETLKDLLESILSKDACKVGLPSLERLIHHPFWQEYVPKFHEQYMSGSDATKHNLKLTNNAKEQIKIAAQKTEQRLRDEQKSVKNQKRLVRVQELMSSEEEKKKIKHQKAKAEQKQSKLRQQNSLQLDALQLNSVPNPTPTVMPRSDSSVSVVHTGNISSTVTPAASTSMSNVTESSSGQESVGENRTLLLDSICNFDKSALRKLA